MIKGFKRFTSKKIIAVYILIRKDKIVYVGSSMNLASRLVSHSTGYEKKKFDRVMYKEFDSLKEIEDQEIKIYDEFKPRYNKLRPFPTVRRFQGRRR